MEYFTSLKKFVSRADTPVAMALFNNQSFHCIAIGYCPQKRVWTLIDAECMPAEIIIDDRVFAEKIMETLSIKESGLFRMQIYCHQRSNLQPLLNKWVENCEINYMRKSVISWNSGVEPEIKFAYETLKLLVSRENNRKILENMNEIFQDTRRFFSEELPFYVANKVKGPEILASCANILATGFSRYASAKNSEEFIRIGKEINNEYRFTMNPSSRPKVSNSSFFAKIDPGQIAKYGACALVIGGVVYSYGM